MDDDVGSVQWSGEMFLPYPTIPYIISTGNSFWAAYSLGELGRVSGVGWRGNSCECREQGFFIQKGK